MKLIPPFVLFILCRHNVLTDVIYQMRQYKAGGGGNYRRAQK